jgi:hypothetical protein
VLIIPSSWGSQLDGDLHHQNRAASRLFSSAVAGEKEDFCKGCFTHISFTFFKSFALLYFCLHRFIKKIQKN